MFFHESGPVAEARISADGRYQVEATVGKNNVMVECHAEGCPCGYCVAARADAGDEEAVEDVAAASGTGDRASMMIIPEPFIPERYENHMTSGLTVDVEQGKENVADFQLTK